LGIGDRSSELLRSGEETFDREPNIDVAIEARSVATGTAYDEVHTAVSGIDRVVTRSADHDVVCAGPDVVWAAQAADDVDLPRAA
jgi:hypothetical protein